MIEFKDVHFRYKNGPWVLTDINLKLGIHRCEGIVGPNGAGKTTLIKLALGLLKPVKGKIIRRVTDIGYTPESPKLPDNLTPREFIEDMAVISGFKGIEAAEATDVVLELLKMQEFAQQPIKNLPRGIKLKTAFGQSIVHAPQIVILDEPTSGLDPEARTSFLRLIRNLSIHEDIRFIISSHIIPDLKSICERIIFLEGGQIRGDLLLGDSTSKVYRVKTSDNHLLVSLLPSSHLTDDGFVRTEADPLQIIEILATHDLPLLSIMPEVGDDIWQR